MLLFMIIVVVAICALLLVQAMDVECNRPARPRRRVGGARTRKISLPWLAALTR